MKFLTKENYHEIYSNKTISRSKAKNFLIPPQFENLEGITIKESIYLLSRDLEERPKCYCGNTVIFSTFLNKYAECCSHQCSRNRTETPEIELDKSHLPGCYSKTGKLKWKYIQKFKIPESLSWCKDIVEAIYCLENGINHQPTCQECETPTNFILAPKNYRTYCSTTCSNGSETVKQNKIDVLLDKYGVTNSSLVYRGICRDLIYDITKYNTFSYLYLMKSEKLNKIKIGVSINPEKRFKYLKGDSRVPDLELVTSVYLPFVYMYENFLHRQFDKHRSPLLEGDGRTEWFDDKCFPQVLQIIQDLEVI